jgi:hypothetical protein
MICAVREFSKPSHKMREGASSQRLPQTIPHCAKINDTGESAKKKLKEVVAPERMTPDEITIWDHESKQSESIFSKLPSTIPEP